ncbi:MAG: GAF domain-containing protein [Anaerolineae bacterium]|nr:GAF domain-containing protein [Anaerolineae bacterium]
MQQAVRTLLGGASGSFFYHLLVLLAVEVGFALAYNAYRRGRGRGELALVWTWGGMLAVRTAAITVALFGWLQGTPFDGNYWSLGRFIDAATLLLMAWGFVLAPLLPSRVAWGSLGLGMAMCLGMAFLAQPATGPLDSVRAWQGLEAGFLAVALALVWARAQDRWSVAAVLATLAAGLALQMASGEGMRAAPVWHRLGEVVAFPAAVLATYQVAQRTQPYATLPPVLEESGSGPRLRRLLSFLEGLLGAEGFPALPTVLEQVAAGMARCLQADECAVVLTEDAALETLRLAAIYNPARTGRGEAVTLPLKDQHVLRKALRQQKPLSIPDAQELVQLQVLLALMGAGGSGPVLILPLALETGGPGVVVASRTKTRREFTPEEAELGMQLAGHAAAAIRLARQRVELETRIANLEAELRSREIQMQEQQTEARREVARAQSEAEAFSQRLYELERELEEKEALLRGARLEAAQHMTEAQKAREQAEALSRKLEEAVRERLRLEEKLQMQQWRGQGEGEGGKTER